jgi:hypothetical protein
MANTLTYWLKKVSGRPRIIIITQRKRGAALIGGGIPTK